MNTPRFLIVMVALMGLMICPVGAMAQQGDAAAPAEAAADNQPAATETEQAPEQTAAEPAATPPAAEQTAAEEAATPERIRIAEAVVCQDVMDRTPIGTSDVIPAGTERIYCFTRVEGAEAATEITHNWYYQGTLKASVNLPIRNANWRTWSSKTLLPEWKGEWMVEVMSASGTPLESIIFFVQ